MTRLIDADELKKTLNEIFDTVEVVTFDDIIDVIDNAPTIPLPDFKEGYKQAIIDGQTHFAGLRGVLGFGFKRYNEHETMLPGEYIVLLEYKYEHEEQFTYELNILCQDDNEVYMLNDSYEGQEHFKILAYSDLNSFSRERLENFSKYFLGGNTNV